MISSVHNLLSLILLVNSSVGLMQTTPHSKFVIIRGFKFISAFSSLAVKYLKIIVELISRLFLYVCECVRSFWDLSLSYTSVSLSCSFVARFVVSSLNASHFWCGRSFIMPFNSNANAANFYFPRIRCTNYAHFRVFGLQLIIFRSCKSTKVGASAASTVVSATAISRL